jgi:alanyl-tRNA synthetase
VTRREGENLAKLDVSGEAHPQDLQFRHVFEGDTTKACEERVENMNTNELRQEYWQFFEDRGHRRIPSAPLLPENDASALFISAGMQPLAPYLLGQPHPLGRRLVNVQRCLRTNDIAEVGDPAHLTFFEMLGNWSLGDYFKAESLAWSYEFLTLNLAIDPRRLAVTVFAGDADAPRDDESARLWRSLGIPPERIFYLPKTDNWWGPVGASGPCGPDSEIFFDTERPDHPGCRPGCPCGKWFEIWNNVFMEYNRRPDGRYERLQQRNVDTGLGVDRVIAVLNGADDIFEIDTLWPLVQRLEALAGQPYAGNPRPFRLIVDHLRSAAVAIADGASPSNLDAGYVSRRLVRRAVLQARQLGVERPICADLGREVLAMLGPVYSELSGKAEQVAAELEQEETRFGETLARGLKQYHKLGERLASSGERTISGAEAFDLYQTYGFPLPLTVELAGEQNLRVDESGFEQLYSRHQELSRQGSADKFRGGLADHSQATTRLHTASHLLQAALRQVLGPEVQQRGSNITPERLRFDFSYPQKLSPEQLEAVEGLVNAKIRQDLPVSWQVLPLEQALENGALAFFGAKYGEQVRVYTIGDFSMEVCGGPHVTRTSELVGFKIVKEESVKRGQRRIRAMLI